jgi:hypothetical protein
MFEPEGRVYGGAVKRALETSQSGFEPAKLFRDPLSNSMLTFD